MLKQILGFIFLGIFTASCSVLGGGECKTWVDAAFVTREFDEQTGEIHLVLDVDKEVLADAQRPVVLFLIPRNSEQIRFRYGQYWEKVDPQSEMGVRALAAATNHLAVQDPPPGGCRVLDDQTFSDCDVVMVTMTGLVGSCCKYPLAYSASIFLTVPTVSESNVQTAVVILDNSKTSAKQKCNQVIIP